MTQATEGPELLWPLVGYSVLAILLTGGMLVLSHFLGERHREKATGEIFESGIMVTGEARLRFPVHYYIVAMFFVIFDLEAAFIVTWAISVREVGWAGYWTIFIFINILLAVLIYEWRTGALDFGPNGKKIIEAYKSKRKKEEK